MSEVLIEADSVSKKFCRSLKRSMLYAAKDVVRNALGMPTRAEVLRQGEFWAVDQVSFQVRRGECLGIIGANGSGKSTLLKALSGIIGPDRGRIAVYGRLGALIEVGAGFHPMLTGRENIFINGVILGMTVAEIERRFEEIVAFAGIGEFLDTPIRFYSSGMLVRLGFSVAIHTTPDVLLVDEVLAVGDVAFQNQCYRRINTLRSGGLTAVIISHNMNHIRHYCDRALYLRKGRIVAAGLPGEVCALYLEDMRAQTAHSLEAGIASGLYGTVHHAPQLADLPCVTVCNASGQPTDRICGGEALELRIRYRTHVPLPESELAVAVYREDGLYVASMNTAHDGLRLPTEAGEYELHLHIDGIYLCPSRFVFVVMLQQRLDFLFRYPAVSVEVTKDHPTAGIADLPHHWEPAREVQP